MSVIEFPGNDKRRTHRSGSIERAAGEPAAPKSVAPEVMRSAEAFDLEKVKGNILGYLEGIASFRNDVSDIVDVAIRASPEDARLKEIDATLGDVVDTLYGIAHTVMGAATREELEDTLSRAHAAAVALSLCLTSFVREYGESTARLGKDEKVVPIGAARTSEGIARLLAAQPRLHEKPQGFLDA